MSCIRIANNYEKYKKHHSQHHCNSCVHFSEKITDPTSVCFLCLGKLTLNNPGRGKCSWAPPPTAERSNIMLDKKPSIGEIVTIRRWEDLSDSFPTDLRDTNGDLALTDKLILPYQSPVCGQLVVICQTDAGFPGEFYGETNLGVGLWFTVNCTEEYRDEDELGNNGEPLPPSYNEDKEDR